VNETAQDVLWLQRLLDDSYTSSGEHLRSIHIDAARLSAEDLVERLTGMQVFVVATVSSDGRPFTGPVDAFLHRGRVHFGTSPTALRARHLARTPAVSASHVRGEELVVTVHGQARRLDLRGEDADFAEVTRQHYGEGWDQWDGEPPAFAIEPTRMFAADMSVHTVGA
jgi:hypothetical protein